MVEIFPHVLQALTLFSSYGGGYRTALKFSLRILFTLLAGTLEREREVAGFLSARCLQSSGFSHSDCIESYLIVV